MSAGFFVTARYIAEYAAGQIHPILIQPETAAAQIGSIENSGSSAALTNPISARVSGSRRGLGLFARTVVLQAPANNPPPGYIPRGKTRIPALNVDFWNAAIKGSDCDYLGVTFSVVSRSREVAR